MGEPCAHLAQASEAVAIDARGVETPARVLLCAWASDMPDAVAALPSWLGNRAFSGGPISPDQAECRGCPCFKERGADG